MVKNATSGRKRLGIFNILVLVVNAGTIFALALSYLSAHISPEKSWLLPFFGLLYPYLVLINLFFMVYWMVRKRWLFLLPAIMILAGWSHLERTIQFFSPDAVPESESQFKLITYNVKNLSNDNVDLLEPDIRDKIIGFLDSEDPDLLCLQEFAVIHADPEAFIDTLGERLNLPYHVHSHYTKRSRRGIDAIIVFSKFPILNHASVKGDDLHNYAMFADLQIGKDTIRLYNVHLESFRFRHEDYNFISELDLQFEENENLKAGSMRIFKKIKTAFSKRASQVDTLVSCIKDSPYPVILCGDFNDTPNSYTYQQLSANLTDSFIESGIGLGNTYIGNLPSYRIDHVLYDNYFTSTRCRRIPVKYSDHYPVNCMIDIRKK